MSKIGISLKINVSLIQKARLFAGKKGQYLDCTAFIETDELDEYGNSGMITQDVSKEEKNGGVKGPILGNAKVFWKDYDQNSKHTAKPAQSSNAPASSNFDNFDDDMPF